MPGPIDTIQDGDRGKGSPPARSGLEGSQNAPATSIGTSNAATVTSNEKEAPTPISQGKVSPLTSTSTFATDLTAFGAAPDNEKPEAKTAHQGKTDSSKPTSRFQFALIVVALCLAIFLVALVSIICFNLPIDPKITLYNCSSVLTVFSLGQSHHFHGHPYHYKYIPFSRRCFLVRFVLPIHDLLLSTRLWQGVHTRPSEACLYLRHLPL